LALGQHQRWVALDGTRDERTEGEREGEGEAFGGRGEERLH